MMNAEVAERVLRPLKSTTLKHVSVLLGARIEATKSARISSIISQCAVLDRLRCRRDAGDLVVTAIDAGVSNFAYCSLQLRKDRKPLLVGWEKFQLESKFVDGHMDGDKLALNPENFSRLATKLSQYLLALPYATQLYAIERQRARSVSSKFVLEPVLRSNILEYLLFSTLANAKETGCGTKDYEIISSDPQRMVNYWVTVGSSNTKYQELILDKNSKKYRIALVSDILCNSAHDDWDFGVELTSIWRRRIAKAQNKKTSDLKLYTLIENSDTNLGTKKDDDLADSFLHALMWSKWLNNYETLVYEIDNKPFNDFETGVLELIKNIQIPKIL
ncbi:hypothetical protein B1J92_L05346g [Nakaseomyces glabratus]|nr:hypothetical protein B1J91_L05346g [Nakaseomyces glabratus]OXB46274.1 hypothetical protein B1J92_L05346g [Nakaseomyces glabratus]